MIGSLRVVSIRCRHIEVRLAAPDPSGALDRSLGVTEAAARMTQEIPDHSVRRRDLSAGPSEKWMMLMERSDEHEYHHDHAGSRSGCYR